MPVAAYARLRYEEVDPAVRAEHPIDDVWDFDKGVLRPGTRSRLRFVRGKDGRGKADGKKSEGGKGGTAKLMVIIKTDDGPPLRLACVDARVGCLVYKLVVAFDGVVDLDKDEAGAVVRRAVVSGRRCPWTEVVAAHARPWEWDRSLAEIVLAELSKKKF